MTKKNVVGILENNLTKEIIEETVFYTLRNYDNKISFNLGSSLEITYRVEYIPKVKIYIKFCDIQHFYIDKSFLAIFTKNSNTYYFSL